MNQIKVVQIRNNQPVTTSRIVAAQFNKNHNNVNRKIRSYKKDLINFDQMFRIGQTYDSYGRPEPTWFMNEKGFFILAGGFTGKRATSLRAKFFDQFKALEKILNTRTGTLENSPERKLDVLINRSIQDLDKRTSNNSSDIKKLTRTVDKTMRVTSTEQYQLKNVEHRVVIKQLGGYDSSAYQKYSSRGFQQCWRDFKDHFNLPRYSDLPHGQFDNGLSFLSSWHLHGQLLTNVHLTNDRITLGE